MESSLPGLVTSKSMMIDPKGSSNQFSQINSSTYNSKSPQPPLSSATAAKKSEMHNRFGFQGRKQGNGGQLSQF